MFQKIYEKQQFLNQSSLKELVLYDPETGIFVWKKGRAGASAGKKIGCLKPSGYIVALVNGKLHRLHRLAWLYTTGEWPKHEIDHINGNRSDNRFCNLREATKAQNNWNKKVRKDSKVGVKNVIYYPKWGAYYVRITANKITQNFGPFKTKDEAEKVSLEKRKEIHGDFSSHHTNPSISI